MIIKTALVLEKDYKIFHLYFQKILASKKIIYDFK